MYKRKRVLQTRWFSYFAPSFIISQNQNSPTAQTVDFCLKLYSQNFENLPIVCRTRFRLYNTKLINFTFLPNHLFIIFVNNIWDFFSDFLPKYYFFFVNLNTFVCYNTAFYSNSSFSVSINFLHALEIYFPFLYATHIVLTASLSEPTL